MDTKNTHLGKAGKFVLLRGLFFVLFGLVAFFWAGPTLEALILTFGIFAVVDGVILLVMYGKHRSMWGGAALWLGIISLLIGFYALSFPSLTGIVLALAVAVRAFAGGLLELRMAASLRKHIKGETLLITNGILSILFAILITIIVLEHPILGLLMLVEVMGVYAVCLGVVLIILSSRIKTAAKKLGTPQVSEVF